MSLRVKFLTGIFLLGAGISWSQVPVSEYKQIYKCFEKIYPWSWRTVIWKNTPSTNNGTLLLISLKSAGIPILHVFDPIDGYRAYRFPSAPVNQPRWIFRFDHPMFNVFFDTHALTLAFSNPASIDDSLVGKGTIMLTEAYQEVQTLIPLLNLDPQKVLAKELVIRHIPRIHDTYQLKINLNNADVSDPDLIPNSSLPLYIIPSVEDLFQEFYDVCDEIINDEYRKIILDALMKEKQNMP